jgi:hypothetical protein
MAALADHAASESSKILMIGPNGAGKTGALVSLVKAGYNLRILDCDNGVEIIKQLLKNDPAAMARVDVETHNDDYILQAGTNKLIPKTPLAFGKAMEVLNKWPGLGSPTTWGTDTVLVVDSLTMLGKMIMAHVMQMAGKPGDQPSQPNWGSAMDVQENLLAMLFSKSIKCHVIVMAHITYIQNEGEVQAKGYPSALGNKLPPKVGSYFNSTLLVTMEGVGANKKRVIQTKPTSNVDVKTPAPGKAKDSYPLETGLADYFKDLHGPLKTS